MQRDQAPVLLYHEKQVASLCGVHCLNTLLQGPTFTEMDLSQHALTLDQQERAFMAEGGMESEDYLRYIAEDSGNVAADGAGKSLGSVQLELGASGCSQHEAFSPTS